jgi:hypothetical protein
MEAEWPAALGALAFALHPVQVESVAWAAEAKDLLAGLLAVAALWQYVRFAKFNQQGGRGYRTPYVIATIALVLAMFSKPSAVVVPLLAGTIDAAIIRPTHSTSCAGVAAVDRDHPAVHSCRGDGSARRLRTDHGNSAGHSTLDATADRR